MVSRKVKGQVEGIRSHDISTQRPQRGQPHPKWMLPARVGRAELSAVSHQLDTVLQLCFAEGAENKLALFRQNRKSPALSAPLSLRSLRAAEVVFAKTECGSHDSPSVEGYSPAPGPRKLSDQAMSVETAEDPPGATALCWHIPLRTASVRRVSRTRRSNDTDHWYPCLPSYFFLSTGHSQ